MSIINDITSHDITSHDSRSLLIGDTLVRVGNYIGTYAANANETTGYPVCLADGSTIADDQDRDELRSTLQRLGLDTECDEEGLVLIQTSTAELVKDF